MRLNIVEARPEEVHFHFEEVPGDLSLSANGELRSAAASLSNCLHRLNASGRPIAMAPEPMRDPGLAIKDRLMRAATLRP